MTRTLGLLFILLMTACSTGKMGNKDVGPKLYVFDFGHITVSDVSIFSP